MKKEDLALFMSLLALFTVIACSIGLPDLLNGYRVKRVKEVLLK